ncbi:hypothetical protein SLS56_011414 [Neofusicoccum ribis]|uniref:Uncharacterized protein n=1 Tax=Neofusicoccum ribis TaxID=45134 RepID=A0ABR3SD40_9PEZI
MDLNPALDTEPDDSTVYTAITPPESVAADVQNDHDCFKPTEISVTIPRPGNTYLIRSASSGEVITLLDGKIILAQPDGRGECRWVCELDNGWFGFRNIVSGRYLGRDIDWRMCCSVTWLKEWEKFLARERPGGGSVLLMTHWWVIRPIGMKMENGIKKLAMIENWESDEMIWEFIEVQ